MMVKRDKTTRMLSHLKEKRVPVGTNLYLPNHSGDHSRGIVRDIPTVDNQFANKKYVDDENSVQDTTIAINSAKISYTDGAAVALNTTHRSSNGTNHSNVVLNDTHRGSDGSNHSKVTANETAIALNTTHRSSDGTNHANVVLNDTHRGSNGQNHADVVSNNTHRTGDGSDHADVATNSLKTTKTFLM